MRRPDLAGTPDGALVFFPGNETNWTPESPFVPARSIDRLDLSQRPVGPFDAWAPEEMAANESSAGVAGG